MLGLLCIGFCIIWELGPNGYVGYPWISMDIPGYVWIALISFGSLGKLLLIRSLFSYPRNYPGPYMSDISMQISICIQ
jgi:hypothetical protein